MSDYSASDDEDELLGGIGKQSFNDVRATPRFDYHPILSHNKSGALTPVDLLSLVAHEESPLWFDKNQCGYLAPMESTLLMLLVVGSPSCGARRLDVALCLSMSRALVLRKTVRAHRPALVIHRTYLDKKLGFRGPATFTWIYADKDSLGKGTSPLTKALRLPPTENLGVCLQVGNLPSKESLIANIEDAMRKALMEDDPDTFCLIAKYFKARENTLSLHSIIASALNGTGLALADTSKVFMLSLEYYRPAMDMDNLFHVFKNVLSRSLASAKHLLDALVQQGITNVIQKGSQQADILNLCVSRKPKGLYGIIFPIADTIKEDRGTPSPKLIFVVQRCPLIGFDLRRAVQQAYKSEHFNVSATLSDVRYMFGDTLGLQRTCELIKPPEYLLVFRFLPTLRFAIEELGLPLPEPNTSECEALVVSSLRSTESIALAPYLLQRFERELSPKMQLYCLKKLCQYQRASESTVIDFLRYFLSRGWLSIGFQFPNRDGLQHHLELAGSGAGPETVRVALISFLSKDLGLDFAAVSRDGEFPLSVALRKYNLHLALHLLREGLIPPKEVLIKYRSADSATLLAYLFMTATPIKTVQNSSQNSVPAQPKPPYAELCERIGFEVIRQLSVVHITIFDFNTKGPRKVLPLELACRLWPVEAVQYLVEVVQIEGSTPGSEAIKKILRDLDTPSEVAVKRYLQARAFPGVFEALVYPISIVGRGPLEIQQYSLKSCKSKRKRTPFKRLPRKGLKQFVAAKMPNMTQLSL